MICGSNLAWDRLDLLQSRADLRGGLVVVWFGLSVSLGEVSRGLDQLLQNKGSAAPLLLAPCWFCLRISTNLPPGCRPFLTLPYSNLRSFLGEES